MAQTSSDPESDQGGGPTEYGARQLRDDAIRLFPACPIVPEGEIEGVHYYISLLENFITKALAEGDIDTACAVCEFVGMALIRPAADTEIENAVAVSFLDLETLNSSAGGRLLLERLPKNLRQVLEEQEQRIARLTGPVA